MLKKKTQLPSVVESLAGYMVIEGDTLYLNEVEVIMLGDEEAMPLLEIKSLGVAVTINDEKRVVFQKV